MEKIYYDVTHPAAFGGVKKLQKATKSSQKRVVDFLRRQDAYTIYKPIRRKFTWRKTVAPRNWDQFQADLADFQSIKRYNSGYCYVLVVVDVLSKYVFYVAVKNKKPAEMSRAFKKIFKTAKPKFLQTDSGSEFTSKVLQNFFRQRGIKWFYTHSEAKVTLAERGIRTLREKLTRIFHKSGRKNTFIFWID